MNFTAIVIRSDFRIRLEFDSALAATAFTTGGTIVITSQDALGANPVVRQRLPIIGSSNVMELALSIPLAQSGIYNVTVTSIPATDLSTATGTLPFSFGQDFPSVNAESTTTDLENLLYKTDLVWTGFDYLEDPSGDLATVSGLANVYGALQRRIMSDGLTWDNNYGAKVRRFVDGPSPSIFVLRGEILRQILTDKRISQATIRLSTSSVNTDEATYFVDVNLIGSSNNKTDISVEVPIT